MKMTIYDDTPNPITFTPSTTATLCAPLVVSQCLLSGAESPWTLSLTFSLSPLR